MKKLMVAFVAVALAAVANASTVSWGVSSAIDATKFSSGTLYLLHGSSVSDLSVWAATQTSFDIVDVADQLNADLASLNTAPNSITMSTGGSGASNGNTVTSFNESGATKTGSYSVFVVGISDDGKNLAVATSTKSLMIRTAATPANAAYTGSNFSVYTAVPEPTSGLLLLLGMAGLALRRKQK